MALIISFLLIVQAESTVSHRHVRMRQWESLWGLDHDPQRHCDSLGLCLKKWISVSFTSSSILGLCKAVWETHRGTMRQDADTCRQPVSVEMVLQHHWHTVLGHLIGKLIRRDPDTEGQRGKQRNPGREPPIGIKIAGYPLNWPFSELSIKGKLWGVKKPKNQKTTSRQILAG